MFYIEVTVRDIGSTFNMLGTMPVSTVPTKKALISSLSSVVALESPEPKSSRNLAESL